MRHTKIQAKFRDNDYNLEDADILLNYIASIETYEYLEKEILLTSNDENHYLWLDVIITFQDITCEDIDIDVMNIEDESGQLDNCKKTFFDAIEFLNKEITDKF
jgi:hypothetical protein